MRLSICLIVPLFCAACEIDLGKTAGDDDKASGESDSDTGREASLAEDEEQCIDNPATIYDDCSDVTSVTSPLAVRRTIRLHDSIGVTDPGRSVGDGPIPLRFLEGGTDPKLAAGVPGANSVHMYDIFSLREGTAGVADTVLAEESGTEFGAAVADPGDIFSDGIGAVAVGAPGLDTVYLYELGVPTTSEARHASLAQLEGARGSRAGEAIAVGDFDGDGITDLAISASGLGEHGGIYIASAVDFGAISLEETALQLLGTAEVPLDGAPVNLGDLNGDGADELGVGSPSVDRFSLFRGGEAWSTSGGTAEEAATTLTGMPEGALGTSAAAVGDIDSDGLVDILVGEPDNSEQVERGGAIYLFSAEELLNAGAVEAPSIAMAVLYGEMEDAGTGSAAVAAGDTDGDGQPEAFVGSPWFDDREGTNHTGAVHFVQGPVESGFITSSSFSFTGELEADRLGASLAGGVDIDGDGLGDVAALVAGADNIEILLSGE
jgi:hypothetical protein